MHQETHHHSTPPTRFTSSAHTEHRAAYHGEYHDHGVMVADFRRRFWISLALIFPILALSPRIQDWLGFAERLMFPGSPYVLVRPIHGRLPLRRLAVPSQAHGNPTLTDAGL
jgi:Cu2+-exporting ATPase